MSNTDAPYSYRQMEADLRYELQNNKQGKFSVCFKEEAEHCKKILTKKGFYFNVKEDTDDYGNKYYDFEYWRKDTNRGLKEGMDEVNVKAFLDDDENINILSNQDSYQILSEFTNIEKLPTASSAKDKESYFIIDKSQSFYNDLKNELF